MKIMKIMKKPPPCCAALRDAVEIGKMARARVDGTLMVTGCCGGCVVVFDLKFCPYCGKRQLKPLKAKLRA